MSNFISAVAVRENNGEINVVTSNHHDSYMDILESLTIDYTKEVPDFVKLELTPLINTTESLQDVESWIEKINQDTLPTWWTGTVREEAFALLRSKVRKMLISGEVDMIEGGRWILLEGSIIGKAKNAEIVYMVGNSQIKTLSGNSRLWEMRDVSKIDNMIDTSNVVEMHDFSVISSMRDYSGISVMYDKAIVCAMYNCSKVISMFGDSEIVSMRENSKVVSMFGDSRVNSLRDNAYIVDKNKNICRKEDLTI